MSYVSAPLTTNTTVIGAGAVHLWLRSSTPDVDLQATVSEVRPDGNETFVQNGWLRANERKLDTTSNNLLDQRSTLLEPVLSMRASDVSPMPKNKFVGARDPAVLRGSRIPRGLADQGHDRRSQRDPTDLGLQPDRALGHADRVGRVLKEHAVEPDPPRRSGSQRAHRPAAVPEPAQRAVPALRRAGEPHRGALSAVNPLRATVSDRAAARAGRRDAPRAPGGC